MAVTHYWSRPTELDPVAFAAAAADWRKVRAATNISLAGFDGSGEPLAAPDHIMFNGASPQCCEPFEIRCIEFDRRGDAIVKSYCKTGQLPYDLCVRVALVILKHHFGVSLKVTSDTNDSQWDRARSLVVRELGYGDQFHLDTDA